MVVPKTNRRWLSFSLRAAFIVTTIIAVCLGYVLKLGRDRKKAILAIESFGGTYAAMTDGPQWLRKLVKDDKYFYNALRVTIGAHSGGYLREFRDADLERMTDMLGAFSRFNSLDVAGTHISDEGLRHLPRLNKLVYLTSSSTVITDRGLDYLKGMKSLREFDVTNTDVTANGVAKLQSALPGCKITNIPMAKPAVR